MLPALSVKRTSGLSKFMLQAQTAYSPKQLISKISSRLKKKGIKRFHQEAEIIWQETLAVSRSSLYLKSWNLTPEQIKKMNYFLEQRLSGEPLAYIFNKAFFYGLEFYVDKRVLIPRPETEVLVQEILMHINQAQAKNVSILDIGTGSGNIAISLTKNLSNCKILATDNSAEALEVARKNIRQHNCGRGIRLVKADLFDGLDKGAADFDIIVSNPPYISKEDMRGLQPEVKKEPLAALYGGIDGLDYYRRISAEVPEYLKPGGWLFLEVGLGQARAVRNFLEKSRGFKKAGIISDYCGIERIVKAEKV